MEQQLFTWKNWDMQDVGFLSFTEIRLLVPIGSFPAGTQFDGAFVNFTTGDLQLVNYEIVDENGDGVAPIKEHIDFKLGLVVL